MATMTNCSVTANSLTCVLAYLHHFTDRLSVTTLNVQTYNRKAPKRENNATKDSC